MLRARIPRRGVTTLRCAKCTKYFIGASRFLRIARIRRVGAAVNSGVHARCAGHRFCSSGSARFKLNIAEHRHLPCPPCPCPSKPLPTVERWDCHQCGVCCRGSLVPLSDEDLASSRHKSGKNIPIWPARRRHSARQLAGARISAGASARWELRVPAAGRTVPNS